MKAGAFAVLTAAGSGTRLGCNGPKALVEVGGVPMLVRAAQGLAAAGVAGIIVTAPTEQLEFFSALFPNARTSGGVPVEVVAGSPASRQASVACGLAALPGFAERIGLAFGEDTPVLVHDAARCLTPPEMIARVVAAVEAGHNAVIPAIPVTDTLKEVGPRTQAGPREEVGSRTEEGLHKEVGPCEQVGPHTEADLLKEVGSRTEGTARQTQVSGAASLHAPLEVTETSVISVRPVVATPDRSRFASVQTPQGFTWQTLRRAHECAGERANSEKTAATDDAGLVEAMGEPVVVVDGDALALKITTAVDLALAELLVDSSLR
ncbi:2-C-methyl-D-erythritol 4-phosphate cytidylyltransferase [Schaalia cardiffensis F0333]|uniref:2-C-methyl-D-erythritol 4-phosphate cytidylyltransferase n=1 Tax=Schaalia cardiffensis F0333 TaxID=888050 RepID=N6WD92_9ACTO|nr:2-C-methyl-D-erythritol 4-phosphate cytidylyltransferase [Schaalia cardiffensis]ENO18164.1 2-C-methyl-D-erythritol 4-phosphate cytidylyltransferase [Schaalia cardiffensis F0333]